MPGAPQITTGADGELLFTAGPTPRPQVRHLTLGGWSSRAVESTLHGGLIVRMTPNGVFTVHRISQLSMHPTSPTPGPGNDIWFLESSDVARITPRGNVRRFRLPRTATGERPAPFALVSTGGDLWFADPTANRIGRLRYAC